MRRPPAPEQEEYLERLKRDIAARLRPVCARLPEAEFAALVDRVARLDMKYRARRTDDLFDPSQAAVTREVQEGE